MSLIVKVSKIAKDISIKDIIDLWASEIEKGNVSFDVFQKAVSSWHSEKPEIRLSILEGVARLVGGKIDPKILYRLKGISPERSLVKERDKPGVPLLRSFPEERVKPSSSEKVSLKEWDKFVDLLVDLVVSLGGGRLTEKDRKEIKEDPIPEKVERRVIEEPKKRDIDSLVEEYATKIRQGDLSFQEFQENVIRWRMPADDKIALISDVGVVLNLNPDERIMNRLVDEAYREEALAKGKSKRLKVNRYSFID